MRPWSWFVIRTISRDAQQAGDYVRYVLLWGLDWQHQLEARAYPGQPTHHSTPPIRPCTCAYHVMNTPESGHLVVPARKPTGPLPYDAEPDPFEIEYTYTVWYPRCPVLSWFTIRRTCPHHGVRLELYHYPNTTVPRSMLEDYPGSIL